MVERRCIACSAVVASGCRTCTCGHVIETDLQTVGGKRFSRYRVHLYSSIEGDRLRKLIEHTETKSNRRLSRGKYKQNEHIVIPANAAVLGSGGVLAVHEEDLREQKPYCKVKTRSAKRNIFRNRQRKTQTESRPSERTQLRYTGGPPSRINVERPLELRETFTAALAEINRRIQTQNLIWISLP